MNITLIAAMTPARVIGQNNQLPWHLPADFIHFKHYTMDKPIVMGRKTFASIGKPLPGRTNIILTRDESFRADACVIAHSLDAVLTIPQVKGCEELIIIGGASIYQQWLPKATHMVITMVNANIAGDAYFPEWDAQQWHELTRSHHPKDDKNTYDFDVIYLERTEASHD